MLVSSSCINNLISSFGFGCDIKLRGCMHSSWEEAMKTEQKKCISSARNAEHHPTQRLGQQKSQAWYEDRKSRTFLCSHRLSSVGSDEELVSVQTAFKFL